MDSGAAVTAALYCHRLAETRHPPEVTALEPSSALFIQITWEFSREKRIPLSLQPAVTACVTRRGPAHTNICLTWTDGSPAAASHDQK